MSVTNKFGIASDHAGFQLKEEIKQYFVEKGFLIEDFGTNSLESVDYPDFVHPLADNITNGNLSFGIVICGSGNGVNITANKHKGIRSALCWMPEIAALALEHNNANVIALPARYLNTTLAIEIINAYLNTSYQDGRHQRRIDKIEI